MKMPIKTTKAHFSVSQKMDDDVRKIALAQGRSVSKVYRDLVEKGLVAGGYRSGGDTLPELVRQAVHEELRPYMERLAAISAKGTQISAAAFFLAAYNGRQALPAYARGDYDALAASARKLGVEYLKLAKDEGIDDFLARALGRMGGDGA